MEEVTKLDKALTDGEDHELSAKLNELISKGCDRTLRLLGQESVRAYRIERFRLALMEGIAGETPFNFECPKCGGKLIIERMKNKRRIRVFHNGEFEGSDPTEWEWHNCIYSCGDCGSLIEHEDLMCFEGAIHFGEWLREQPEWIAREEANTKYKTILATRRLPVFLRDKLRELAFVCCRCGARELDECWWESTPIALLEDGHVGLGCSHRHENIDNYECSSCGWILENEDGELLDKNGLIEYLRANAANLS